MKTALVLVLTTSVLVWAFFTGRAVQATTPSALTFSTAGALNYVRPCSFKDITPVSYIVGASGATGTTGSTGTITNGVFEVSCGVATCFGQGSTNALAIAKTAATTCNQISATTRTRFLAEGTDFIAFTGASGTSASTCVVTECR